MFTGLVEEVGKVVRVEPLAQGEGRRLALTARLLEQPLEVGASLAVDGVCLTVVDWQRGHAHLEVGPETLERSTLGRLSVGAGVNLERPLRLGDRLGGHLVAGHVDGVGRVQARTDRGPALDLFITAPAPLLRYVIEKGSIAVDGVSLTVNRVEARGFEVSLIPHTQAVTTLPVKALGAEVNLEVDLIGKYVEKLLGPREAGASIDWAKLKECGFVD
jgi:riboflavin synthase